MGMSQEAGIQKKISCGVMPMITIKERVGIPTLYHLPVLVYHRHHCDARSTRKMSRQRAIAA